MLGFDAISVLPISALPAAAAPPTVPALSWQGVQPALLELGVGAMIPYGPIPGSAS